MSNAQYPGPCVVPLDVLLELVALDLGDISDATMVDSNTFPATFGVLVSLASEVETVLANLGILQNVYQTLDWASASTNATPPPEARASGYWRGVAYPGPRAELVNAVAGAIRLSRVSTTPWSLRWDQFEIAAGGALDHLGSALGVARYTAESDADFRGRMARRKWQEVG